MPSLRVFKKGEQVDELALFRDETFTTVIGRKGDIVVDHKSISRRHATFHAAPGGNDITLRDCGGTHGTTLNGSKLEPDLPIVIKNGDVIVFGKSSRSYEVVVEEAAKVGALEEEDRKVMEKVKEEVHDGAHETTREERERQIAEMTASMRGVPPAPTPSSLYVKEEGGNESDSSEDFGPMPAPPGGKAVREADREELARKKKIPVRSSVKLSKRAKAATGLSAEPSGARLVVGSQDGSLGIFHFGGMDSRQEAFRSLIPEAGIGINHVAHSPSGDRMMVVLSNAQPLLYDREGRQLAKCIRGDMYLRDLSHTKGHTMEVNCSCWHPTDGNLVLTGSADGTVRVWDLASDLYLQMLRNQAVLKVKGKNGGALARVSVLSCCYSCDGRTAIAGCADGTVHLWDVKNPTRAKVVLGVDGDGPVTFVTCVSKRAAGNRGHQGELLMVRVGGQKGCLLFWDMKTLHVPRAKPIAKMSGCPTDHDAANASLNEDKSLVCVAANSVNDAWLCFYDVTLVSNSPGEGQELLPVLQMPLDLERARALPLRVLWMGPTNQIAVANSTGSVQIFYDPALSTKGVLLSVGKAPPSNKASNFTNSVGEIFTPHALPMFRQDAFDAKRKQNKAHSEAMAPARLKGEVKISENSTSSEFTRYVVEGRKLENLRAEDPREALLKMEHKAKEGMFFGKAYKETQPQPILATKTFEEEEEELQAAKRQRNK